MKYPADKTMAYLGVLILLGIVGCLFLLMTFGSAKGDTLICQTIMESPPRVIVFSVIDKEIKNINAAINAHSRVDYTDGRKLYISPNTFDCHEVVGDDDEKEQALVDQMVDMITGGDLE